MSKDEMINSIAAPYFNDLDFGWTDDGNVAVQYRMVDLKTTEMVPKHRMLSAVRAAARILSRTDVPYRDSYGLDDLLRAYAKGYNDARDGREPRPEEMFRA